MIIQIEAFNILFSASMHITQGPDIISIKLKVQ